MAGTILTPSAIWEDFNITEPPSVKIVGEKMQGDTVLTRILIDGRTTENGTVKIYGVVARSIQVAVMPAVLIVQDVKNPSDDDLAVEFAKRGYYALSIDIAGYGEDREFYTIYPDDVAYSNYYYVKDNVYEVSGDVKKTCWYEWTAVVKYAVAYLKGQSCVTKIGGIGIAESATPLWQVAATEDTLSASVFVMNAGWRAYEKNFKFGNNGAPQFSENMMKYVAGVEPQSYSSHVKCPSLLLCSANSKEYDLDRSYDTIARMDADVYTAVDYSVNFSEHLECSALNDIFLFFGEFLINAKKRTGLLPDEVGVKCDLVDGSLETEVSCDEKNLKEVCLYIAEETPNPALRTYRKLSKYDQQENGNYKFAYTPYHESGIVFLFARVKYKNGFSVSSNVVTKRFKETDVRFGHKENIVYSGRLSNAESVFIADFDGKELNSFRMEKDESNQVTVSKGPMDIDGVFAENGLTTFKVNAKRDKPNDDALLMLDLYLVADGTLTVKLVTDIEGSPTEYFTTVNLNGGNVWHNVKLEKSRFKTEEGRILKSYEKVNSLSFKCNGRYLINNVLWV